MVSTDSCSAVVSFSSHGDFCAGKDSSGYSEKENHSQQLWEKRWQTLCLLSFSEKKQ